MHYRLCKNSFQWDVRLLLLLLAAATLPESKSFLTSLHVIPTVRHKVIRMETKMNLVSPDDKYHLDLVRILSKKPNLPGNPMQRTSKPSVLRKDIDGVEKSILMLRRMIQVGVATEESIQIVFEAILRRGRVQWLLPTGVKTCAAEQLETLSLEVEEFLQESLSIDLYNIVLEAYANCANSRGNLRYAERAEALFQRIDSNAFSIFHVLKAWAWQQGNRDVSTCADKANDYLQLLEEEDPEPSMLAQAYDAVLEAYSKANGGAAKADSIFSRRTALDIPVPMDDHSNIVLAWAKDDKAGSAVKATKYLTRVCRMFVNGTISEEPELIAFSAVISAWRKANDPEKAEETLWMMQNKVRPKAKFLEPTVFSFNAVCHAYVKDRESITPKALNAISDIISFMENNYKEQPLIKPDSYTYNALITAMNLSESVRSMKQMEDILDRMEATLEKEGGTVTNKNFNVIMNAYAKSSDPDTAKNVLRLLQRMRESKFVDPDIITYTTAIECLTKSADPDFASDTALRLLAELHKVYNTTKKPDMMPNSRCYAAVINAVAKSTRQDRAKLARRLLKRQIEFYESNNQMMALRPSTYSYNYIINSTAYHIHLTNDELEKAEAFKLAAKTYQEMRDDPNVRPDEYTYFFWFKACANLLPRDSPLNEKFVILVFKQCCKEGLVNGNVLNQIMRGPLTKNQIGELLNVDPRQHVSVDIVDLSWSRNVKWRNYDFKGEGFQKVAKSGALD
mmetsp:Transcript_32994/g.49842  ORF Transcript_32994/g.49842 Transcript_32994/m.49842 type:complete len:736 (+) Transcript_32994:104-2311(+)